MSRAVEKQNFATILSKRQRYYTNPGSREANDYEIQIDKKGHKTLKCVGSHDIWEEIQSYKDECDISLIIARAAAGDTTALNKRQGFYADITDTPETLAEAQNAILKLSQGFDRLPAEIRAKFDNSKEKFVQEFGSDEFAIKMGFVKAAEEKKIEFIPGLEEASKPLTPEGGNKE